MALVVVGGQSRNVGKTSVVAGLISAFADLNWTAIKITPHHHGLKPEQRFVITEEVDRTSPKDTSRYLAAGARRALLVEVRPGTMQDAANALRHQLATAENVMIESNAILEFLQPDLYLLVLDPSVQDFKDSARQQLDRADAIVTTEASLPEPVDTLLAAKPVFRVSPPDYVSAELLEIVRERIATG